jgi:hypothetical protein
MSQAFEQSAECYKYAPLQHNQIRILLLQPSTTWEAPMECYLQILDLEPRSTDQAPNQYETLSYCWGDPSKSGLHWIQCHDKRLELRENLHSALRYLRLRVQVRRLWIDAICINQHDLDERGNQVAIMAKIFNMASQTLIWLGEDSDTRDGSLCIRKHNSFPRLRWPCFSKRCSA